MTKDEELRLFAQLAGNPKFQTWLEQERETTIKYLAQGPDNNALRRAQGRYALIEKMTELLEHAKKSLH